MQSLATDTDSQYLLFGVLQDVSLRDADGNVLQQWLNDPEIVGGVAKQSFQTLQVVHDDQQGVCSSAATMTGT